MGFLLLLLLSVTLSHPVEAQEDKTWAEEEDNILVLEQHNFAQALQKHKWLLVQFYAPWSGHCQALAAEYAKAAAMLKNETSTTPIGLAKVDITREQALSAEFGITGYPDLKLFRDGNRTHPVDFTGQQDASGIVAWLKWKVGPNVVLLEDAAAAGAVLDLHPVTVIGFFHDLQNPDVHLLTEVASATPEVAFALTDHWKLFLKYNVTEDTISLFRRGDSQRADFPVDAELGLDADELAHFLRVQTLDLVMEFTKKNFSKIFGAKVPNHLLLFVNKTLGAQLGLLGPFQEAAAAFRGQVLFVLVDVHGEGAGVMHHFGLKGQDAPTLRLISIETNKKYRLSAEELTVRSLHTFCQAVLQGKIQPYLMTEETPDDWNKQLVKVVVGKTFEQVVFDETKNVFVKFYAPWCPHSRAMAQAWEELGEKYKEHKDIVIAEMDATANEVADLPIPAYPTLYYFPAGPGRQMIEYTSSRDLESFSRFLDGGLPSKDTGAAETSKKPKQDGINLPNATESRDEL